MSTPSLIESQPLPESDGCVIEMLPNSTFRVILDNGREIFARLSGRTRRNYRCVVVHGRVRITLNKDNPDWGAITQCLELDNCS